METERPSSPSATEEPTRIAGESSGITRIEMEAFVPRNYGK
jgi:hypothetical protein